MTKHIVLIGFKNVGKSSLGRALSQQLDLPHLDTDEDVQEAFAAREGQRLSCREIVQIYGEAFFRELEHEALRAALNQPERAVVTLGGGAPIFKKNRQLLVGHILVHVTAHQGSVFERIMLQGRPAFFPREEDPCVFFNRLWAEREPIYQKLAQLTVDNSGPLDKTVKNLKSLLPVDTNI